MSKQRDVETPRGRCKNLNASVLNLVRFKLNNVAIQYMQYNWIGSLIVKDKIHIQMGDGHGYDHESDTITFNDADAPYNVIVHEATHALIDACYPGLTITKGTGEACAYLAETVFNIAWKGEAPYLEMDYLTPRVADLARRVLAYNSNHTQAFVCDRGSIEEIIAIIGRHYVVDRLDKMNGIRGV